MKRACKHLTNSIMAMFTCEFHTTLKKQLLSYESICNTTRKKNNRD